LRKFFQKNFCLCDNIGQYFFGKIYQNIEIAVEIIILQEVCINYTTLLKITATTSALTPGVLHPEYSGFRPPTPLPILGEGCRALPAGRQVARRGEGWWIEVTKF